jgi:NAD(P)-dependent dehydrogenase (short-subunit alcohol dehydrogenase family)
MNRTAIQPIQAARRRDQPERRKGAAELAGKVAVIIGGGREARAVAAALASAGAAVSLAAAEESAILRAAGAIRSSGGRALAIPLDPGEQRALAGFMETTGNAFGRVDVAVNSPGGGMYGSVCRAVYLAMRYEVPALLRSGGGVVVNSALSPSQEADCVIGLTRAAALDHAGRDVRINSIASGPGAPEDFAAAVLWLCSERAVQVNGAAIPVGLRPAAA